MQRKRGFTLIEVLVVIAIIAILMGIIMPALHTAKKIATGAVSLGNERSLLTGWLLYADDNDGFLINNRACYELLNSSHSTPKTPALILHIM